MSDDVLTKIAHHLLALFILSLGLQPSEDEYGLSIKDHGPYRVWTQFAAVPTSMANTIDPGDVLIRLADYLEHHNAVPTAVKFQPYNVEAYVCPCGCGTFLYVSIYHTA